MTSSMIWIVMIAVMVLSMIIQARLKSRFEKYSEVPTGLSGAEVAQRMGGVSEGGEERAPA